MSAPLYGINHKQYLTQHIVETADQDDKEGEPARIVTAAG